MEDVLVTTLNLDKICRVCLLENEMMHSIYSQLQINDCMDDENEIHCIYEILMNLSAIKIDTNDGLPNMICTPCVESAQSSFRFQKLCNRSQAILDAYLLQNKELEEQKKSIEVNLMTKNMLNDINDSDDTTDGTFVPLKFVLIENAAQENLEAENNEDTTILDEDLKNNDPCIPDKDLDILDFKKDISCMSDDLFEEDLPVMETAKLETFKTELLDDIPEQKEDIQIKKENSIKSKTSMKCFSKIENGQKVYCCSSCNKTYKHSGSLRIHMRLHNEEKPYTCVECGKGYKQYTSLVYHKRGHTGERPYTCKICGKKYRQSGTLTAHMRVHTGQRPFLCSICGRGFRQAPDLTYHMRTHTKERPYMCNICGKTMTMQCHLVQHMRSHTGERPFQCSVCNKAFPSSTRLKRHAIIHTGLKPYTCEVCEKSFNRSSSLRVHSKIHTDERPHICPICNKGFIQAHALRSHIITHSAEITKQLTG